MTRKYRPPYVRTRERANGIVVITSMTGQDARTGSKSGPVYWSTGPHYNTRLLKDYEQMTDVVTPGFAQYASDRKLVNNPMTRVTHSETMSDSGFVSSFVEPENGNYHSWYRTNCLSAHFKAQPPQGAQRVNVENLEKLCQTAALAGVNAPDLSSIPALIEARKTLNLIAGPLMKLNEWMKDYESRIQRGVRNKFNDAYWRGKKTRAVNGTRYRKSDGRARVEPRWSKATSVGEFLSDAVLSINLGWKPALMEIDALLHKVPLREATPWQTSRATRTDSATWSKTETRTTGDGIFTIRYDFTEKVTVRVGVVYEDDFQVAKHFGVRLSDVPEAFWEVTRFSWLVDYVLNVGDYLGAVRASIESKLVNHFTVTTIEETCTRTMLDYAPPLPYTTVELKPSGGGTMSHTTKTRNPAAFIANFAYLPLEVTLKPSSHAQNVISLLTSYLVDISKHSASSLSRFR